MRSVSAARRLVPVLTVALLLSGCSTADGDGGRGEFDATVLDVVAADTLVLDVDGEERTVRLGGVVVPTGDECLAQDAQEATEARAGGQRMTFAVVGRDDSHRDVVAVDWMYEKDLATDLVAEGLAVPDSEESDIPPEMLAARNDAMERGRGLFEDSEDCTFAAMYAEAAEGLAEATDHGEPTTSEGAGYLLAALVAAVQTARATERFAQQARQDLRLLAYSSQTLSAMMSRLATSTRSAVTESRRMRALKGKMRRKERAERVRLREEAAEFWSEYHSSRSGPSSGSSSGSSGSGGGYNGPRCYEPGGKVWHPC
jgi:micrococcal nuclease